MRSAETFNKLMHWIGLGLIVILLCGGAVYVYAWHVNPSLSKEWSTRYMHWRIDRAVEQLSRINKVRIDPSYGQCR